jgi:hypothetical protein
VADKICNQMVQWSNKMAVVGIGRVESMERGRNSEWLVKAQRPVARYECVRSTEGEEHQNLTEK